MRGWNSPRAASSERDETLSLVDLDVVVIVDVDLDVAHVRRIRARDVEPGHRLVGRHLLEVTNFSLSFLPKKIEFNFETFFDFF